MDSELLVEQQADGRRLIEQLERERFEPIVSFWLKANEDGSWQLYIASPSVNEINATESYRRAYAALRKIHPLTISASDLNLVNDSNPLAIDVIKLRDRQEGTAAGIYTNRWLGGRPVSGIYIYPSKGRKQFFTARYYKTGQADVWTSTIERGQLLGGAVKVKGAVAYISARMQGETADDEKFAMVDVILELDPRYDEEIFTDPGIRRVLTGQAWQMADEMFKDHHPEAMIEREDDGD